LFMAGIEAASPKSDFHGKIEYTPLRISAASGESRLDEDQAWPGFLHGGAGNSLFLLNT